MKHIKIKGNCINTEKKWSYLKGKQQEQIVLNMREKYKDFLYKEKRHPNKEERKMIVDLVYSDITDREIWIPYSEVYKKFLSKINQFKKIEIV